MQHDFSQLHNNVMERNFVRVYSLIELPLRAQGFGLFQSNCPVAYNPDCTVKQIVKKERVCSGVKFRKSQKMTTLRKSTNTCCHILTSETFVVLRINLRFVRRLI
jgi:hypothetical protein